MERQNPSLTIFDVDGTLFSDSPDDISGRAFWNLHERGIFLPSDEKLEELTTLREEYINRPEDNGQKYHLTMAYEFDNQMRSKSVKMIKKIAKEQADHDISCLLYPEIQEEIAAQRENGAMLGMISGSPDVFIQAMKRHLGFDFATGTRHFHNRKEYHPTRHVRSRATEKHIIAEKWRHKLSNEMGCEAVIASVYGDTMNDFSLLQEAHDPVAVNPKPDLSTEALRRNYRIIHIQEKSATAATAQSSRSHQHA